MNNERKIIVKKNMFDFIEILNPNDIDSFKVSDDQLKVVMTMKDGEKVEFPIKTGFGNYEFYILIEKITGEKSIKSIFPDAESYIAIADNAMTTNEIRNILLEVGSDANPNDIKDIMIDGFKHTNLFTLAEQESNLKKYVLIALKLLNELDGDVNKIYAEGFQQKNFGEGVYK